MVILRKGCKPDNFESHNSLNFRNIWGLPSSYVDCESFLESSSPGILALCETNLNDSTDSGNFSVRGYLPLIWKDSTTHMHSLTVYVKEGLPFTWDVSPQNSANFLLSLLHSVSYSLFPLSPSSSRMVFDSISSYMRFSWSTHLLMSLSLKALMSIIRTGWPILVAPILIDLVNSVNISLFQMTLLRWLTFLLRSQTKILTVLLFWTYFFLLLLVFVLQWLSLLWKILIKFLSHFPLIFH